MALSHSKQEWTRQYMRRYYKEHREEILRRMRERYHNNPEFRARKLIAIKRRRYYKQKAQRERRD